MTDVDITTEKQLGGVTGKGFMPGQSGNPAGRPKGSISPITRVKQIFEDNPAEFEAFIKGYLEDPNNRKHIVEMIDGKPGGDTVMGDKNVQINNFGQQDFWRVMEAIKQDDPILVSEGITREKLVDFLRE
jgi:hypothetical protein